MGKPTKTKAIEKYEICYPNPLQLRVGEKIQLFEKSSPEKWRDWKWCKDSSGNEGWISETYFKRINSTEATIVKDYTAKEIAVNEGEDVDLIFTDCGWSWCRKTDGSQGWLPTEILVGHSNQDEKETVMIRNLTPEDFDEYYRVRLKSLQEYPVAYSSMPKFFVEAPREAHIKLLADSASDSSFFVKGFFENDKLIGIIGMLPETRECVDHKASLWGFYVDPNYQGRKIGAKLLDAFLVDARKDKRLRQVRLAAATSCEAALALFQKFGFEKYGRERDSIRDDQRYYDQIYMQINCESGNFA